MADEAKGLRSVDNLRAADNEQSWGQQHQDIVELEAEAITVRRRAQEARRIQEENDRRKHEPTHTSDEPPFSDLSYRGRENTIDAVGLALSGGGIRSSAICLGVLQAFNHNDL